ncbi:TIGR01621 family pseudouridine synthase [Motiliproteus sp. MSK22-1]|uniref:TIGR01621 family pseudouridine synthase n=1 Tax=Motiliproteus sp. MSK22-1 TaxID=1897630 RepID=UPI00097733B7|nr:TIGR01621 family pseudouridine synthase [Motiliproteus sp. MSK22-1]OMH25653.1 RNA pseudouridine synthase [Motiliproteus sp. MSK22-1]
MYRIVSENERFVLIDKSPDVGFHTESGLLGVAEQLKSDLELNSLYPVHRLDKMTSGLLVFAKDLEAARRLNELFRERQVDKFYLALSDRKPKKKQGLIKGQMTKGRRGSWKLVNGAHNPARTQFVCCSVSPGLRLFLLKPLTGKTHQLRVAMKSLGAPIVGDKRYGGGGDEIDRGYLHAYAIGFKWDAEEFRFICPPEEGRLFLNKAFDQALLAYQDPWSLSWP